MSIPGALYVKGERVTVVRWDGGQWVPVIGAPAVPRPKPTPPDGPIRNVATLCGVANYGTEITTTNKDGIATGTRHEVAVDVVNPRLRWKGTNSSGVITSAATVRAWAGRENDTPVPVTVNGATHFTFDPRTDSDSADIISDPVPVELLAGEALTVYVWADPVEDSGQIAKTNTGPQAGDPGGAYTSDDRAYLAQLTDRGRGFWALRPASVLAPSDHRSWVAVGSSSMNHSAPYPERALAQLRQPSVKFPRGGDSYTYWGGHAGGGRWYYIDWLVDNAPSILTQIGSNTSTHVAALGFWVTARRLGFGEVVQITEKPRASSTDRYVTLENQKVAVPALLPWNEWLRDGAPVDPTHQVPLEAGTTDPSAVRASVILGRDHQMIRRDQGHPVDCILDTGSALEYGTTGLYDPQYAALAAEGDGTHLGENGHAFMTNHIRDELALWMAEGA